jgi:isocitrate dehydrogenase (NAD+)
MKRTVVVMPGDGIGAVVVPEAVRVLTAAGFDADFVDAEIGWSCWLRDGDALPQRTIALLAEHKLGLLGAITSKPPAAAEAELQAPLKGRGLKYASPILALRQHFAQDICVRPCRSFPGNPTNFVRRLTDGSIEEPALDIVVFRQNTEGLYAGVEWTDPPQDVRRALALHPRFAPFANVSGRDLAITVRIVTREACRRILDAAFRYAAAHKIAAVTLAEKPNVLRETSGLFEEVAREVSRTFPQVGLSLLNIDALLMELARRPEGQHVIVASNLFGDIVSDAVAGVTGGPGFACSANIGHEVAIFEPTHGSAPAHARFEVAIVNPIAAILAGALLAEHAGAEDVASRIRSAIGWVIADGRIRTYDMLRLRAGPDVVAQGAATTRQMADAVIARVESAGRRAPS